MADICMARAGSRGLGQGRVAVCFGMSMRMQDSVGASRVELPSGPRRQGEVRGCLDFEDWRVAG